tara:strand:- start:8941 stop:9507 length:567 start_codon:yes stop_codon:yes gene_type:complete
MNEIIEFISQPWSWYASGIGISLVMFLLLWSGERFGVSSTLKTLCSIGGAGKKISFFAGGWKDQSWNLVFVLGAAIGGYIAVEYLNSGQPLDLSAATITDLKALGIPFDGELAPLSIFNWENLTTVKGLLIMIIGGFLVGFGTRWAGGCTSGHAISGLSNLQIPSLIAVIGFFIGGLVMTFLIFPLIF